MLKLDVVYMNVNNTHVLYHIPINIKEYLSFLVPQICQVLLSTVFVKCSLGFGGENSALSFQVLFYMDPLMLCWLEQCLHRVQ